MRKFLCVVAVVLVNIYRLAFSAEIVHGIDVQALYDSTDWNSQAEIKEIIETYSLIKQYQAEYEACGEEYVCYDKLAEKIIDKFYSSPEESLADYKQFKRASVDVAAAVECRLKITGPSGVMCDVDTEYLSWLFVRQYIKISLSRLEEKLLDSYGFLKNYI